MSFRGTVFFKIVSSVLTFFDSNLSRPFKKSLLFGVCFFMGILLSLFFSAGVVHLKSRGHIFKYVKNIPSAYTGIVLGARVNDRGFPSGVLRDRLLMAIELYDAKKIQRILVSGDHGQEEYDEVNAMRLFLVKNGIPDSLIFMDHAGFDTYSSMVRAKEVFCIDTAIIITQDFHLQRAVFTARTIGIEAVGAVADRVAYPGIEYYQDRERLAKVKAVMTAIFKPAPKYLGPEIPITGSAKKTRG